MATLTNQKALGAFYTADSVARFLVRWAVRSASDSILDPSCGGGVFLEAALARLKELGSKQPRVLGIDFDRDAAAKAKSLFPACSVVQKDFFTVSERDTSQFNAVVGNPPFIRYQTFSGAVRAAALLCAHNAGVRLPQLTSSWAPFLVHAVRFVGAGGRLAMVVPAELGHAQYAQEVLCFLTREFEEIKICMFRQKLFPELSEDTFLLLANGRGSACRWFAVVAMDSIEEAFQNGEIELPVDLESIRAGRVRLMHYLLPAKVRELYRYLSEQKKVVRLGDAGHVGIGYVTGCNDFFHLSEAEVRTWRIPVAYLSPAVRSLENHRALIFRHADWNRLKAEGRKAYLLALPSINESKLPSGIRDYLARGRQLRVHTRFKCKVRDPWYSVPHARVRDAFLSYMSGGVPRLVLNAGHFVAPNTLHLVHFLNGRDKKGFVAGWYSSLTRLSCEMEGHPLGGGMLKLEPTEAERLLVALPRPRESGPLIAQVDELLRLGEDKAARDLVDRRVLRQRFGLSASECSSLSDGAAQLERWRMHR